MELRAIVALLLPVLVGCSEDLFIAGNVDRNADCEFEPDIHNALPRAEFDIAKGGTAGSNACERPFVAHLLVENPNSDSVVVESAEIRLMDSKRRTIRFTREAEDLPNPFLVTPGAPVSADTSGVVALEVIPIAYASQLTGDMFVGAELVAELELFGKAAGGEEIGSNVFSFQVAICDGCRTLCASDPGASDVGECSGRELGVEREFCIDYGC